MDSIIAPWGVKADELYTTSPIPSMIISIFFDFFAKMPIFLLFFAQFQQNSWNVRLKSAKVRGKLRAYEDTDYPVCRRHDGSAHVRR